MKLQHFLKNLNSWKLVPYDLIDFTKRLRFKKSVPQAVKKASPLISFDHESKLLKYKFCGKYGEWSLFEILNWLEISLLRRFFDKI